MFNNAQEFYEHLDDCVLRVVQQEEPSEAINERHLTEVAHDQDVQDTLDRYRVHNDQDFVVRGGAPVNEEDDEEDEAPNPNDEGGDESGIVSSGGNPRSGKGNLKTSKGSSS